MTGMALHLIKLAVGASSLEDLAAWQRANRRMRRPGGGAALYHTTLQTPKRQADVLAGGSLYWVIKGMILARQRIVGFSAGEKEDGSSCCRIELDCALVPVRPVPRRAFQGWRYLPAADAPPDIAMKPADVAVMPSEMRVALSELGLL
jgi:hypothetical protein